MKSMNKELFVCLYSDTLNWKCMHTYYCYMLKSALESQNHRMTEACRNLWVYMVQSFIK